MTSECNSCSFKTDVEEYPNCSIRMAQKTMALCALCAGTLAGNAYEYPDHYPDRYVLQTICYVGNAILAELRQGRSK